MDDINKGNTFNTKVRRRKVVVEYEFVGNASDDAHFDKIITTMLNENYTGLSEGNYYSKWARIERKTKHIKR